MEVFRSIATIKAIKWTGLNLDEIKAAFPESLFALCVEYPGLLFVTTKVDRGPPQYGSLPDQVAFCVIAGDYLIDNVGQATRWGNPGNGDITKYYEKLEV